MVIFHVINVVLGIFLGFVCSRIIRLIKDMSRPEYSPMKQGQAGDKLYIWLFTYALVVMLFSGILTGRLVQETRDENRELEKRIEALEDRFDRLDLPVVRRDTVVFTDILTGVRDRQQ